jgi:hypothetical protein
MDLVWQRAFTHTTFGKSNLWPKSKYHPLHLSGLGPSDFFSWRHSEECDNIVERIIKHDFQARQICRNVCIKIEVQTLKVSDIFNLLNMTVRLMDFIFTSHSIFIYRNVDEIGKTKNCCTYATWKIEKDIIKTDLGQMACVRNWLMITFNFELWCQLCWTSWFY